MADDLDGRRGLSFAQAEGLEPLPRQLNRTEVSPRLRSMMWRDLYDIAYEWEGFDRYGSFSNTWLSIIRFYHVSHLYLAVDDFDCDMAFHKMKMAIMQGDYIGFYGTIQFLIGVNIFNNEMIDVVSRRLEEERSAYRIIQRTLLPLATEQEAKTIQDALADTKHDGQIGAHAHLAAAVKAVSGAAYADCITESIGAVEAVARTLTGQPAKLSEALAVLERRGVIHASLKRALSALYGYTSDEQGLRHSLLERGEANVDEADALLMLGSCSSFVSYVLAKKAKQDKP